MARFILDYDTDILINTQLLIADNVRASMVSPDGDSSQYCLVDVVNALSGMNIKDTDILEDFNHLCNLLNEGVNYIEIVY
jgi:hypothetical protein